MLLKIWKEVKIQLKNKNILFTFQEEKSILEFLGDFSKGDIINPYMLKAFTNIDKKTCYLILTYLVKYSYLKIVYIFMCPYCKKWSSDYYESIEELIEKYKCKHCGDSIIDLEYLKKNEKWLRILYKVK